MCARVFMLRGVFMIKKTLSDCISCSDLMVMKVKGLP